MSKGWKNESQRHSLSAKGIRTGRKLRAGGVGRDKVYDVPDRDMKFVGKDKFSIKEYVSLGRFQNAVQRSVNSVHGNEYFWQDDTRDLRNKRTGEVKELTLKEAFVSEDVWEHPSWHSNLEIGQFSATLGENYGIDSELGGVWAGGFDIRFEPDEEEMKKQQRRRGFEIVDEEFHVKGKGQIYVYMGRYVDDTKR